jgi:hypothetical protein
MPQVNLRSLPRQAAVVHNNHSPFWQLNTATLQTRKGHGDVSWPLLRALFVLGQTKKERVTASGRCVLHGSCNSLGRFKMLAVKDKAAQKTGVVFGRSLLSTLSIERGTKTTIVSEGWNLIAVKHYDMDWRRKAGRGSTCQRVIQCNFPMEFFSCSQVLSVVMVPLGTWTNTGCHSLRNLDKRHTHSFHRADCIDHSLFRRHRLSHDRIGTCSTKNGCSAANPSFQNHYIR